MFSRKIYGQSRIARCPFCNKKALTESQQGIPVCLTHKSEYLDIKCVCGEHLEVKKGKWGPYFFCINCGNISFAKGLSMAPPQKPKAKEQPTETIIRSDELDFM